MKGALGPRSWADTLISVAVALVLFALALSFAINVVVRALPIIIVAACVAALVLGVMHTYRRLRGW